MTKQHAAAATAPPPLADDGDTLGSSSDQNVFTALARGFFVAFNDHDADARVALAQGKIIEAHGYLSDERTLVQLGLIPAAPRLCRSELRQGGRAR